MTKREQMQENFEDALFALLMDEFAEREGRRLLEENERLKADPAAAVPPEIDRRCLRTIRQAAARDRRSAAGRRAYRVFRQAAMVIAVATLLFVTAFAAFPEVRSRTLELIIEISDGTVSLTMEDETASPEDTERVSDASSAPEEGILRGYRIPAAPEGFVLDTAKDGRISSLVRYLDADGATLSFEILAADDMIYTVDTRDAQVTPITIHGGTGLLIEREGSVTITWGDTKHASFVTILSDALSVEQLTALADEVVYAGDP